jgi:hypothetical protein
VISLSSISVFFPRGLHELCNWVIEYWLQTHAVSSFDLSSISRLGTIAGAIIAGPIGSEVDTAWLIESNGLIFESRAKSDGLD